MHATCPPAKPLTIVSSTQSETLHFFTDTHGSMFHHEAKCRHINHLQRATMAKNALLLQILVASEKSP